MVALWLCLLLVLAGCATGSPDGGRSVERDTTPAAGRQLDGGAFTTRVPLTYQEPNPGTFPVKLLGPKTDGIAASLSVAMVPFADAPAAGRPPLDQVVHDMVLLERPALQLHARPVGRVQPEPFDGEQALRVDYLIPPADGHGQTRHRSIVFYHHNDLWRIDLETSPAAFNAQAGSLELLQTSWQWRWRPVADNHAPSRTGLVEHEAFTFQTPPTYREAGAGERRVLTPVQLYGPETAGVQAWIGVAVVPRADLRPLKEAADAAIRRCETGDTGSCPRGEINGPQRRSLGGEPALQFDYHVDAATAGAPPGRSDAAETPARMRSLIAYHDRHVWEVDLWSSEAAVAQESKALETVIATWRWR